MQTEQRSRLERFCWFLAGMVLMTGTLALLQTLIHQRLDWVGTCGGVLVDQWLQVLMPYRSLLG